MAIADKVERYEVFHRPERLRRLLPVDQAQPGVRGRSLHRVSGGAAAQLAAVQRQGCGALHDGSTSSPTSTTCCRARRRSLFTALSFFGLDVGAVHTELDLSKGEPPGEGDEDHTQNLVSADPARQESGRGRERGDRRLAAHAPQTASARILIGSSSEVIPEQWPRRASSSQSIYPRGEVRREADATAWVAPRGIVALTG